MRRLVLILLLLTSLPGAAALAQEMEIITSGQRKWALLMEDLRGARESICLEYYGFASDSSGRLIGDILMQKAQEGIPVRLILENFIGGLKPKAYFNRMAEAGVEICYFTDPDGWPREMDYRDHRKIVVIDGRIGYVGGMNLSNDYRLHWRDTHLRLEGDAVAQLEGIFYQTWRRLGCSGGPENHGTASASYEGPVEIVSGGPFYPVFLKRYLQLLDQAKHYVYLQTPYFCPPDTLVSALRAAAERGVDVRLLVPEKTDHPTMTLTNQRFYPKLLEAGVRVYEYLPRFNHSKVAVSDDIQCWVGSVNLDNRSFFLDYEVCAFITGQEAAVSQKEEFLGLLEASREVTAKEVAAWSPGRRFLQWIPRLIEKEI